MEIERLSEKGETECYQVDLVSLVLIFASQTTLSLSLFSFSNCVKGGWSRRCEITDRRHDVWSRRWSIALAVSERGGVLGMDKDQ